MGRIHVLSENVANKIAAGEVVERPASVAKELLENSLDAGATRIRIQVEAGGKKLIQITDNGCGMVRDDALLAFERHATSKIKNAEDLLSVATLGFRGEALPSIASVSRLRLETRAPDEASGTVVEINGGKIFKVEEAGLPPGTSIAVRDLFFNIPARKKFLKAESTELSHIASLVTHYALAHPDKHFELHSATNAMLVAPPVAGYSERVYQVFGKEVLDQLIPIAAVQPLERIGLPQPPPWRRKEEDTVAPVKSGNRTDGEDTLEAPPSFGEFRVHGFVSKPEIQKLNRNSIYVFVNGRLIRDRLIQHAIIEAYRNILPPTVFPVVLLFLDLPDRRSGRQCASFENRSPLSAAKRHARFRARVGPRRSDEGASGAAVRDRNQRASQRQSVARRGPARLEPAAPRSMPCARALVLHSAGCFATVQPASPSSAAHQRALSIRRRHFGRGQRRPVSGSRSRTCAQLDSFDDSCAPPIPDEAEAASDLAPALASLKPLGQIRDSFILAVNPEGLWIVDQHVAHERVLFEKILKQRAAQKVESQRLLLPLVIELTPAQQAVFTDIADELAKNGFEVEPFGARSVAVKIAPAGVDASAVEHMLHELLDQFSREEQA